MKTIKNTLTFLLLLVLASQASFLVPQAFAQSDASDARFVFGSDTKIYVDGTSSLHDWTCEVEKSTGSFATSSTSSASNLAIETGKVVINIDDIECGKGTMNKKLYSALTPKDVKTITFVLGSATATGKPNSAFDLKLKGTLEIAGVTKPVEFTAAGSQTGGNVKFKGSVSLNMTDYGVDPPTALLGTLHTGDKVTIRFEVVASPESNL